jgi:hypothetical protein
MDSSFEQTLVGVWRQVLIENAKVVALGAERYPVRQTPKHHLREVDFVFDGRTRNLEGPPLLLSTRRPQNHLKHSLILGLRCL